MQSLTTAMFTPTVPSNSNCETGLYYCAADKTCLPLITKCNFVDDCSDKSDESTPDCTQLVCNPKTDQLYTECGINIMMSEGSNYTWSFASSINFTNAYNVHFANMFSTFLYLNLNTGSQDDYSNLVTQMISETSASCMLSFKYACHLNHCPLQVSIISRRSNVNVER